MKKTNKKRLLILGAGVAGKLLLNEIKRNPSLSYKIMGFCDDFKKIGTKIGGYNVLGKIKDLKIIVTTYRIEEIIISIPSLKKERLNKIISICEKTNIKPKILPPSYESLYSLTTGRPWIRELRPINLEDLLGRDAVKIDVKELENTISNRVIMVTGGGGSIGSELCKQIAELNPKELIILENCEFNLYEIDRNLKEKYGAKLRIRSILGDIRHRNFIDKIFMENKIDLVFHAAAYKHVPLMEDHIKEAIKNNIFGTCNVAAASEKYNVKKFILVSTDKAVNPTSVMGVSKRISEIMLNLFNKKTEFIIVRFGNVLGSKGSIIPLFEEQIKKGGPLTITHPKIKRYFMTIPEASQLIIQAAAMGKNREVLVLDMGKQYFIKEIAEKLIKLHGLIPGKDIKMTYIGIKPGEKLSEELWTRDEKLTSTKNKRIFISKSKEIELYKIKKHIRDLIILFKKNDKDATLKKFEEIVPSYHKSKKHIGKNKELKVLIVGGTGFMGTNLKKRLDIENIYYDELSRIDGDLSNLIIFDRLPKYDIVFHLAASLPQKPNKDFKKDIQITENVLNYCEKNNSKLIFVSSSAVYGTEKSPIKENSKTIPINEYGKSKLECERLIIKSNINGFILRVFNAYGRGQYEKLVLNTMLNGCNNGEVILTKNVKRDFIEIRDVIDSLILAGNTLIKGIEIINVGSGEEKSLLEILEIIIEESGKKPKIEYRNSLTKEVSSIYADISKAQKLLNWDPKITIEEGIRDLITHNKLK